MSVPAEELQDPQEWLPSLDDTVRGIRLLQLPQSLGEDGRISLQAKVFLLDDHPVYYALSYTWACPLIWPGRGFKEYYDEELTIECNGRDVRIKRNLYEALEEIIRQFPGILLWNDALCIRQAKQEELTAQIMLMGDIYSLALTVIIWLYKEFNSISKLHEYYTSLLPKLSSDLEEFKRKHSERRRAMRSSETMWLSTLHLRQSPLFPSRNVLAAFTHLFGLAWFHRRWTFQESVLAKRHIALCGPFQFKLGELLELSGFWGKSGLEASLPRLYELPQPRAFGMMWQKFEYASWGMMRTRGFISQPQSSAGLDATMYLDHVCGDRNYPSILMYLIRESSLRFCDRREDLIRSLLGLILAIGERVGAESYREEITKLSDSNAPNVDASYILMKTPFLAMLSYAGYEFYTDLSWRIGEFPLIARPQPLVERARSPLGTFFNASLVWKLPWKEMTPYVTYVQTKPEPAKYQELLNLRAKRVGRIQYVSSFDPYESDQMPDYPEDYINKNDDNSLVKFNWKVLTSLIKFLEQLPSTLRNGFSSRETLWRVLMIDIGKSNECPASTTDHEDFCRWVLYQASNVQKLLMMSGEMARIEGVDNPVDFIRLLLSEVVDEESTAPGPHPNTGKGVDKTPGDKNTDDLLSEEILSILMEEGIDPTTNNLRLCHDMLQDSSFLRRLLFPDWALLKVNEDMIGLGDRRGDVGDEVWIIESAKVPFILRPAGDPGRYFLRGEAYVHGIMNGEFILKQWGNFTWDKIQLA